MPVGMPASPLDVLLAACTITMLGAIAAHMRQTTELTDGIRTVLRGTGHVIIVGLLVTGLVLGLGEVAERFTAFAAIAGLLRTLLLVATAGIALLFVCRQFQAPPWWRLQAWTATGPTYGRSHSVRSTFAWIISDSGRFLLELRVPVRLAVIVGVPATLALSSRIIGFDLAITSAFLMLGVLYVALGVAWLTASRIPRVLLTRLEELRIVAHQIAAGQLAARVGTSELGDYEELGDLVREFNRMATLLQQRDSEVRVAQQRLEHEVKLEAERSTRDPLTQLRNHRYFQEALAAELYRCARTGETVTIAIIDLDDFKAVNDTYGHQEGDAVLVRTAHAFTEMLRPYDLPARLGGEEFGVIFPSTSADEAKIVMDRIMAALQTAGPQETAQTFSGGIASFPQHAQDQATLFQLADSSAYAAKLGGKAHSVVYDPANVENVDEDNRVNTRERDAQLKAAKTLVRTVDSMDQFGSDHSENVGRMSAQIAVELGYDDTFAQQIYLCGLLHDVGKLGVDQDVIQKRGELTAEEFAHIRRYSELSAQIVMNAGLGEIANWVRHHHEHFDGSGYPDGLRGHDIPLASRIVLVAEAFDSMTSDRAYRRAMSVVEALSELRESAGHRYDPDVVAAFVALLQRGEIDAAGLLTSAPDAGEHAA